MQLFPITEEQYNYLLPVIRSKLQHRITPKGDLFHICGSLSDYKDAMIRCRYL